MAPIKAMILAAGLGTRLRPFSLLRPKPLFPILDKPLLKLIIERLRQAGIGPIVVNAHHLREQISAFLNNEPNIILQEEEKILGTGGGLRLALQHFDQAPVLITNGDIFHTIDPAWVYEQHGLSDASVTLVLHDYPRFNNVLVAKDNRILGFNNASKTSRDAKLLAFTGIHVIDPAVLRIIPRNGFYDILDCYRAIIRDGGTVRALVVKGHYWTDMGTPVDYLNLHGHLLSGKVDGSPFPAAPQPPHFYYGDKVDMGKDVCLEDWVCLGSGCKIGDGAKLSRVVVWDGARVAAGGRHADTIVT